ncbi:hypothetical protein Gohar_002221 [Gossypium harknessii]|uniref:Uncharacterized protein n=1 Tax=Gossypium harknessii TaxID=34285 RepID=A0A7J9HK46_9ROSI|nr:hypothetical protein [Gossypium harknessii]
MDINEIISRKALAVQQAGSGTSLPQGTTINVYNMSEKGSKIACCSS